MASTAEAIRMCMAKTDTKYADIARRWNTTRQAVSNKAYRKSWSADELADIANMLGAQLVIRFPDGLDIRIDPDIPVRDQK